MITYSKYRLDNGLTLIVSEDRSTPLVTVNTLYGVGARDEEPSRTGFAHLFEHLMFGGTKNVPDYDRVVSGMCGDSNASTNNDYTSYYLTVPARNLETALWIEADRMRQLDFSPQALKVQQSVVTEEYNFRYVNQPYGDVWMLLRPLCYKVHPYRWSTIGSDIRHVQEATLDDVEAFFYRYYCPNNAIVAVVGNVDSDEVVKMVERLYGDIPAGDTVRHPLPTEPEQTAPRHLAVQRHVPSSAIYMCYGMAGRLDDDYRVADLVSDILSNGKSSRLYNELVKHREFFTDVDAFVLGSLDPGLFVVSGKLSPGACMDEARNAVEQQLMHVAADKMSDSELTKVVNKFEATFAFSQYKAPDCAEMLCYYEWLGRLEWINSEPSLYRNVTTDDIRRVASSMFSPQRLSLLEYEAVV